MTSMAEDAKKLYTDLIDRIRKAALLGSCGSILGWEERSYMPRGGVEHRANQLALISGMTHEMSTAPEIGDMLSKLEQSDLMSDELSPEAVNIREIRRSYDKSSNKAAIHMVSAWASENGIVYRCKIK